MLGVQSWSPVRLSLYGGPKDRLKRYSEVVTDARISSGHGVVELVPLLMETYIELGKCPKSNAKGMPCSSDHGFTMSTAYSDGNVDEAWYSHSAGIRAERSTRQVAFRNYELQFEHVFDWHEQVVYRCLPCERHMATPDVDSLRTAMSLLIKEGSVSGKLRRHFDFILGKAHSRTKNLAQTLEERNENGLENGSIFN